MVLCGALTHSPSCDCSAPHGCPPGQPATDFQNTAVPLVAPVHPPHTHTPTCCVCAHGGHLILRHVGTSLLPATPEAAAAASGPVKVNAALAALSLFTQAAIPLRAAFAAHSPERRCFARSAQPPPTKNDLLEEGGAHTCCMAVVHCQGQVVPAANPLTSSPPPSIMAFHV